MLSSNAPLSSQDTNLFKLLFDLMPISIAVFDSQFKLLHCNPAWSSRFECCSDPPAALGVPGKTIFELFPGNEALFETVLKQVMRGELDHLSEIRTESCGAISYWDGVFTPVVEQGQVVAILCAMMDITGQMQLREVERLQKAAEGLRDILEMINSNHSIQEVLDFITFHANQLLGSTSTMIRQVFLEDNTVRTVASCNLPADFEAIRVNPFYRGGSDRTLLSNQPVVLEDVRAVYLPRLASMEVMDEQQRSGLEATVKYYRSLLKIPLFVKNTIYGALTFHFEEQHKFSEEDLRLASTLAGQAALAIENARLIDKEKEQAVVEERGRLARELHDAVTQTLFSTTLTAEVLPRIWERSPEEGHKKLEELRELTRGALAEMRTLLMELRPDALADAELDDLLRHLANAFIARARVPVQLILHGAEPLPLEVKIAFYRIAQEALNNIMKYADASQVTVALSGKAGQVDLSITDDGVGFDPDQVLSAGHFGLRIMRERAEQVGAALEITSLPEGGAHIHASWRNPTVLDPTPEVV